MVSNGGQRGATGSNEGRKWEATVSNGEQWGAMGINGLSLSHFCGACISPKYTTHLHTRKHYNGCHHLQPISHLRGAMLKDVRLNRRHVRVDLVGRAKLVRGLVRSRKEEGRRKKEEVRREKEKGKRKKGKETLGVRSKK